MATIALVGNKGGAGKTTLSVNLASGLNRHDATLVLDADPQRSVLQWRAMGEDPGLDVVDAVDDLPDAVAAHRDGFGHLVIDCPPSVESITR